MINATLLNLPEMQKILSEIRLISRKISLRSEVTPEERAQLITLSSRLIEINDDLAINMEVAFSNHPQGNRQPKLTQNLKKINSQVKQLIKQLNQTIYRSVSIKYDAYINRINFAVNSSLNNCCKTVNGLDSSLQYRIIFFVKTRQLIGTFLIKIAILIAIFVDFYRAIRQTVFVLDEASQKMPSGNLGHKNILDNRDEEGKFVGAFNKIADALSGGNKKNTLLKESLKAENMRMICELNLTRKIQQMLLSKDREIKEVIGLDIAGFMEAAEEAGGHYYDVLQHKGRVKIGMDDVREYGWGAAF